MRLPGWLKEAFRGADDALDALRRRPRRLVFDARTPMNYVMWRPVAERLAADRRIEQWHMAGEEPGRPYELYGRVGVTERIVSRLEAQLMRFDLYVSADFVATWLRRRVRRLHIFHGVAGKYGFDAPGPEVAHFDAFFFVNRDRMRRYVEAGVASSDGAYLIGMPKVDRLVDGSLGRAEAVRTLRLDPSRRTVLYAPTWSTASSLPRIGEALLDAIGRLEVNVLVKLHDRTLDPRAGYSGGVDWGSRMSALEAVGRLRLVRDSDSTPALAAADLLVTDHSSIGFEFLLLDRPVVVLDEPELLREARVSPLHVAWLREAAAVARGVDEAIRLIRHGFVDPGARSTARHRIARRLFHRPGTATDRAVRAVYRLLALAPPKPLCDKERGLDDRHRLRGDPGGGRRETPHASHA